tara:strand:+ start:110286 stop:110468 length:183 start_codon:yes stop_codon:yes gene_type:complete
MNSSASKSCHSIGKYLNAFSTAKIFSFKESTSGLLGARLISELKLGFSGKLVGIPCLIKR